MDIKLVHNIEITTVEGKGFLLRLPGDNKITKLGFAFRHILPMLKRGCSKSELIQFFSKSGLDETVVEEKVSHILISLEESGLLVGGASSYKPNKSRDMSWETSAFNSLIELLANSSMFPTPSVRNIMVVALTCLTLSAFSLWGLIVDPVLIKQDYVSYIVLILLVIAWFIAHEISHGVVARRSNIGVRAIGLKLADSSRLALVPYCRLDEKDVIFDKPNHIRVLLAGPAFDMFMLSIVSFVTLITPNVNSTIFPYLLMIGSAIVVLNTSVISPSDIRRVLELLKHIATDKTQLALAQGIIITLNMLLALLLTLAFCLVIVNSLSQ